MGWKAGRTGQGKEGSEDWSRKGGLRVVSTGQGKEGSEDWSGNGGQ